MEDPITFTALFLGITRKQLRLPRQPRNVKRRHILTEFHLLEGVQIRKFHSLARTGQFHSRPRNKQKARGLIIVLAFTKVNTTSKPLVFIINVKHFAHACSPLATTCKLRFGWEDANRTPSNDWKSGTRAEDAANLALGKK